MPRTATATKAPAESRRGKAQPPQYKYSTEELEARALEIIQQFGLTSIDHVCSYMDGHECSRSTFYGRGLNKSNVLKDAILVNRGKRKSRMLHQWVKEDAAPVLQIAGFKLMADDDELERLNGKPPQNNITNNQQVSTPAMSQRELALRFVVEAMAQGHTLEDATKALQAFTSDIVPEPVRNEVAGYLLGAGEPEPETT